MPFRPEPHVNKPQVLLLSLAIATVVAACSNQDAAPAANGADAAPAADANALTLDESNLPPVNRFSADQLDTN